MSVILNLVHHQRINEELDLDLAKVMDLSAVKGCLAPDQINKACKLVVQYGFRSICVPSRWLNVFRAKYPALRFSTVANYPFGYHPSDVVIRELQGIVGAIEDWDNLGIDFVLPKDFNMFLEDYAEWHQYVPLRMVFPWSSIRYLTAILPNHFPEFPQWIQLGTSFDFETPPNYSQIAKYVDDLRMKGYKVKISAVDNPTQAREYLAMGAELLGIGPRLAPIQTKIIEVLDESMDISES